MKMRIQDIIQITELTEEEIQQIKEESKKQETENKKEKTNRQMDKRQPFVCLFSYMARIKWYDQ